MYASLNLSSSTLYQAFIHFFQRHFSQVGKLSSLKYKKIKFAHKSFAESLKPKPLGMIHILLKSPLTKHITKVSYSTSADPSSSLTLHFLKNSCGLPQETALPISEKIHFKTTKTPHSVLSLLSYHFSKPDIIKVITRSPKILLSNADKTLNPKFEFLNSIGFSGPSLVQIITALPTLLHFSLRNKLLPNYKILKNLLHTDEKVIAALKSSSALLVSDLDKLFLPKVKILEENGVSVDVILKFLIMYNKHLMLRPDRFDEIFEFVKKTGISPKCARYAHAFAVLGRMAENEWEMKVDNFKKLEWSEEEVMFAFARHPYCMKASTDKIVKNFEFYKDKFDWDSNYVSRNPVLLSLSFEKRVMVRYRVLCALESKGLYNGRVGATQLLLGEKCFLKKYVMMHYEQVQEIIDDDIRRRLEELELLKDN